jgi:hypothetical protein
MTFSPSEKTLELLEGLLIFASPSKVMLELLARLLFFPVSLEVTSGAGAHSEMTRGAGAPSEMTHEVAAPSELLPDVVWGCSDFLLVTSFLLIF